MTAITTIGLDLAKKVFQVHGVDAQDEVVVARRLRRKEVLAFFAGISCSGSLLAQDLIFSDMLTHMGGVGTSHATAPIHFVEPHRRRDVCMLSCVGRTNHPQTRRPSSWSTQPGVAELSFYRCLSRGVRLLSL